ncbi:MAG: hypothetical protein ACLGI5_05695 [Thermoleophilia bacterium]
MQITESNVSQWVLRPDSAAREQRVGRERETPSATIASQLDSNPRDGWIDEDDLPYDQFELLERARAAAAARAALTPPQRPEADASEARETPAPPPAAPAAARVDVTAVDTAQPAPQVDLLA